MRGVAWGLLSLLLAGCAAPGEAADAPRWEGGDGGGSSRVTLTGEGEADISGEVRAHLAKDVVVEVYVDRECPRGDAQGQHLAQRALQLGDVDGSKE